MKKVLSLALSFTLSCLSLCALAAAPARAQQLASTGTSIGKLKEEYERLLAVDRDPSTEPDVREINRKFLEERRAQLRSAIETRLAALRKYQTSMTGTLSDAEGLVIGNSIQALERDLAALKVDYQPAPNDFKPAPPPPTKKTPRARLVTASAPKVEPRPEPPATAEPAPDAAPAQARPILLSPGTQIDVPVSEYQIDITLNEPIDDLMVSVFNDTVKDKPAISRPVEMKPSFKGRTFVVVKLAKGANRIEVDDLKRINNPDVKAVTTITYTPPTEKTFIAPGASASALNSGDNTSPQPRVLPEDVPEYDWGRVRAYFTGGVILSKERSNFSKSDIFLDFTLDKNYFASRSRKIFKDFNSFFDARLTAIPVTQPADTSTTPCETNTPDCANFINSEKAALLQAGFYLPMYGKYTTWLRRVSSETTVSADRDKATIERTSRYERNALFFAPLVKGGVQTITGGRTTAEGTRFGGDDVFNFFSYGVMLGHFRIPTSRERCRAYERKDTHTFYYDDDCYVASDGRGYRYVRNTNLAPELISWLTISRGRWESFELTVPTGFRDPNGNPITVRERPWRYEALGRLKIPNSPFIIGFDGNFGKGPDDLRFIFGTRFDVGKVLTALKVGQATKQSHDTALSPEAKDDEDNRGKPPAPPML
jgi:hypothetical protein